MAEMKWQELRMFNEKVAAYLATHTRIVGEFDRSLRNARHYIQLAHVSKAKEPLDTISMLEQIKEIDLLSHLSSQMEAFQEVSDLLPAEPPDQEAHENRTRVDSLREHYENLLREAESQQHDIDALMQDLDTETWRAE